MNLLTRSCSSVRRAELLTNGTDGRDGELFNLEVVGVVEGRQHRVHQRRKVGLDVFPCSEIGISFRSDQVKTAK